MTVPIVPAAPALPPKPVRRSATAAPNALKSSPAPSTSSTPVAPTASTAPGAATAPASVRTTATAPPSPTTAAAIDDQAGALRWSFTASGEEYFRIWIVNLLLTLLTLGVYSAWAKVRREKYFYQHCLLDGTGFDYHGTPKAILRGRLLALALLGLTQADFLGPIASIGGWVLLLLILPWLMQRSLHFRLANTSYRGLRLSFDGSVGQAYRIMGGFAVLASVLIVGPAMALVGDAGRLVVLMVPLVFLLLYPMLHAYWRRYAIGHVRFGNLRLSSVFLGRQFMAIYFAAIALWFLMALPAVVLVAAIDRIDEMMAARGFDTKMIGQMTALLAGLIAYCMASSIWPYITARVQNLTWSGARIGKHPLRSDLDPIAYVRLQLKNLFLTLITLGMYRPFAAIATARMRIAAMTLQPDEDFHRALAEIQPPDDVAVGAEALDLIGFDISL